MFHALMTEGWKGVKNFCGINKMMPKVYADSKIVENNDDSNRWENTIIRGKNPYCKTKKLLDGVLNTHQNIENLTFTKRYKDEDGNLKINVKLANKTGNDDKLSSTMRVDTKISNMFKPYFEVGDEQSFGFKFETENDRISGDVGIRQKYAEDAVNNVLYTSAKFEHPAMVVNAKCKLSQFNHPGPRRFDVVSTNDFGYKFNNFGVLAGSELKLNNSEDFKWHEMCDAVKFGLVFPVTAGQLTLKPNDGMCMLDAYWKINDKFEAATSMKANWRNPEWRSSDHELGVKYKHSDSVSCNLKTDLSGTVSAGLLLKEKSMKLRFCFESNVRNLGEFNKVSCERMFSTLKFIEKQLRSRLSESKLEAFMLTAVEKNTLYYYTDTDGIINRLASFSKTK